MYWQVPPVQPKAKAKKKKKKTKAKAKVKKGDEEGKEEGAAKEEEEELEESEEEEPWEPELLRKNTMHSDIHSFLYGRGRKVADVLQIRETNSWYIRKTIFGIFRCK